MSRPRWAHWLDRLAPPAFRLAGRVLRRPSDGELHAMAGREPVLGANDASSQIDVGTHIERGRSALKAQDYAEALHCFGQAIQINDEARWAWHGRGDAMQLSGHHVEAERAYGSAMALDPSCGLHHAGHANALAALGRLEEANAAWTEALRLDPGLQWMREGQD